MTTSLAPTDKSIENLQSIAAKLLGVSAVRLESIGGGRNSRVYRVVAPSGSYAFKTYFRDVSDPRARMETDFESLTFLWENGERSIPRPLAAAAEHDCALYEWIDGGKILSGDIAEEHVRAATGFLARLAALKHGPAADRLHPASEACFSGAALVECLHGRLQPLLARTDHAGLSHFLHHDLLPALDSVTAHSRDRLGEAFNQDLPREARTLSPSDFGFHNALLRGDGTLIFLDLEYFGWDDPVKMICDFLLHPGMNIPPALKRVFATSMLGEFAEARGRIPAFYPLFGLKWCIILLNEFLPAKMLRREFAGMNERDREARQSEQLAKARNMLSVVLAGDQCFPYGD